MIRVALVGTGGMARYYRSIYARMPGVCWELAIDINEADLAACRSLGAKRTSTRFEDALAPDIDLVDISTPNHLHERQATAALQAGKHVLLQKPIANSLAAADAIVAAAKNATGRLGIYMSSYNNPLVWEIKRLVSGGHLGEIQSVRARDSHRGGLRMAAGSANWRGSREQTGGGSFIQLSIHAINLMQWWLDAPITEIFAYSANQRCPNIGGDDVTVAVGKFQQGVLATFDSGYASEGLSREIYGSKGRVILRQDDCVLDVETDEPYRCDLFATEGRNQWLTVHRPAGTGWDDLENPLNQQRMFIQCLQSGQPFLNGGEIGRRDLAVVAAAYESAATGRPQKVKLA